MQRQRRVGCQRRGDAPTSSRMYTTELIRFHSAVVRSQSGFMFSAGAKVSTRKVSGKIAVNMTPRTASTDQRRAGDDPDPHHREAEEQQQGVAGPSQKPL